MSANFCKGCKYYYSIAQNGRSGFGVCQYFLMTGKRRPCKGGEGCTVKERKRAPAANIPKRRLAHEKHTDRSH